MRLSELKTGEKGVIVKVLGHGSFRKRIVEMGFVRGKLVTVLLNAPLKDPIKYQVMGYEILLRKQEAELIEVVSESDIATIIEHEKESPQMPIVEEELQKIAGTQRRMINVALVGNPNSGKTSLFNVASGSTERVGNYSGVTVDAKEGYFSFQGYKFKLTDLPGTYSLTAYSPEELYVRKHIIEETPDIIINVVDASNLERNLYLTTQLIDMNVRMIIALNMYDELEKSGNQLDCLTLSKLLGVPVIPTVSTKGRGIDHLFHVMINLYEGSDYIDEEGNINPEIMDYLTHWHQEEVIEKDHQPQLDDYAHLNQHLKSKIEKIFRHIHINHGALLEEAIDLVKSKFPVDDPIRAVYSTRFLAIKLLEKDKEIESVVKKLPYSQYVSDTRDKMLFYIKETIHEDSESAIMDAKYGYIAGALKEVFVNVQQEKKLTKHLDAVLTHKYLSYPIFLLILFLIFQITFSVGQYPVGWIEWIFSGFGTLVGDIMSEGPLKNLLVDGIIGGVGAVIVFLPNILILYICISFLEDSGYMARASFIMDQIMHKIGLHGKSFIPLVMGFGCNVPAIMATRMIESRKSRLITMLIIPLMSCSARLPVFIILISAFFTQYQGLILFSIYIFGVLLAALMARIFSKVLIKGEDLPFVMELPPYRMPTLKVTLRHSWSKGKEYLKKMGGIILIASVIIWFFGYFPNHDQYQNVTEQQENSYLGTIGKSIEPTIKPLGFDWKMGIGLLAGIGAKELIA
ncbi:MAG: ferrous iron transport protein B, partial [Bacteroidales bacterium]|nr:ferrous iron transport protein B [Bacteroidales bacterium]